jgi:hypothetical protein
MAAHLITEVRSPDLSIYKISGTESHVEEYIFSTPESRSICNVPEIVGYEFTMLLKKGLIRVLRAPPLEPIFGKIDDKTICVMHFLRGGLNFRLRDALAEAYGYNRHYCSFMTSQRYRRRKEWIIKQDQYRKFSIPEECTIFLGDVIATGTTISNGLKIMFDRCIEQEKRIRNFVLFTIGCDKAEGMMDRYDEFFRETFPGYGRTFIFYGEGKFSLADTVPNLTISMPGTDLLRYPALLAPEFELSQYEKLHYPMERCTIYDVGAKSFEYEHYLIDVIEYWEQLERTGMTLMEAYRERWPEEDYTSYEALCKARRAVWKDIPEAMLVDLYEAYRRRWTPERRREAEQPGSLATLCKARVAELDTLIE